MATAYQTEERARPDAGAIFKVIATAIRGPVSARGALQRVSWLRCRCSRTDHRFNPCN